MGFTQMLLDEGRKEGKKEGEILILRKLISRRFGNIPEWAEDCLKKAEHKDLEMLSELILDAGSIEDIFKRIHAG